MPIAQLAEQRSARVKRSKKIGLRGRQGVVVDGVFGAEFIRTLFQQIVEHTPLSYRRVNSSEQTSFPGLSALIYASSSGLGEPSQELARQVVRRIAWRKRGVGYSLVRAQVNVTSCGDVQGVHRDSDVDVTAVYFANPEWSPDWLGELLFYDDESADDVIGAVTPKPGRLAIFESAAPHRAGVPSVLCRVPRVTVALKFRVKR